jgi:hypothetical protein
MTDGDAIRSAGQLSFRSGGGAGKGVLYEFGADAALSVGSPQTFMQIAGTFNNASYLRTGLLVSMTNTASAVNSKLFDVQLAGVSQFNVDVNGSVGIGTTAPTISGTGKFDMNADTFRLRTARTPASAAAAGNAGEICWDANYLYVAVNTNTWVRTPILTWV